MILVVGNPAASHRVQQLGPYVSYDCKFSGNIRKRLEVITSIFLFESLITLGALLEQVIFAERNV